MVQVRPYPEHSPFHCAAASRCSMLALQLQLLLLFPTEALKRRYTPEALLKPREYVQSSLLLFFRPSTNWAEVFVVVRSCRKYQMAFK